MMLPRSVVCFLVLACKCLAQAPNDLQHLAEKAEREIVRLSPKDFPELPTKLRADLQLRHCTIPQVPWPGGRQNVISGEFARHGQKDWAVLCSVRGVSSILIFWNGSTIHPADIVPAEDINYLQTSGDGHMIYSRSITPVGAAYIMDHYKAYGGPKPPPMDHQGIDDAFVEKASVVLYLYRGTWLHLTGAD